ncbi:LINE-1 retrotransposable element ORF2 protein, partial [Linum perenne]
KSVPDLSILQGYPSLITGDINDKLCKPITLAEVKTATFQLGPLKAPGPDGYPGRFFQRHWDSIGHDLFTEIEGFFNTAVFPPSWNNTHIVLIPKTNHPEQIQHYRPISLTNFRSKIISKVLASRLKPVMPFIISELQSAFTGTRTIQDNVIIAHEVIHKLRTRKKGKNYDFLLKVDMMKAFDRISWDFLLATLRLMGFSQLWVSWIEAVISSVKFSVLINGIPSPYFNPTRGIRQGDPLSPYLFIIVSNVLSFLIQQDLASKNLKGIKLNYRCPDLSHVLFADDTLIFGKATLSEASQIKLVLQRYCSLSGQAVNDDKSALFFSANTPEEVKLAISEALNIPTDTKLGKYLGMPAEWGNSKTSTFKYLLDRMQSKAESWTSLLLSHAGRETLIKSVLQSIPTYIFSCFKLPATLITKMDSLISRFWWSGDAKRRSIHWCSANKLTRSKASGGLGFRSFKDFNTAFLAKLAWRILTNPEALWVRLLKALYFPRCEFLKASPHHRPSWLWNSIIGGRAALLQGLRKNIGNGEDTGIDEPWMPDALDFRANTFSSCKVSDCILKPHNTWNRDALRTHFAEDIVQQILLIPIGPSTLKDRWIWHHDRRGIFTIKSCYHMIRNAASSASDITASARSKEWKWLWQLSLPPKIRFFIWRVCHNALPTMVNLASRNCSTTRICPRCTLQDETLHHMVFQCRPSAELWARSFPSLSLPQPMDLLSDWVLSLKQHPSSMALKASLCIWTIWKGRNEKVFRNTAPTPDSMLNNLRSLSTDLTSNRTRPTQVSNPISDPHQRFQPSSRDHRSLLCDGSFSGTNQKAGYSVIMYDTAGTVVDGRAGQLFCRAPICAEATAVLHAVLLARLSPTPAIVYTDCLQVTNALKGSPSEWPWDCSAILASIAEALQGTNWISIKHCRRQFTSIADKVAKLIRDNKLPPDWLETLF